MNSLFRYFLLICILIPITAFAQYGVLGPDISTCKSTTQNPVIITLNATTTGATNYSWSTGTSSATAATIQVSSTTAQIVTYWVDVTTSGGIVTRDSVKVEYMNIPNVPIVTSPVNTCAGNVSLSASVPSGSVPLWYTSLSATTPIGTGSPFAYSVSSNTTMYVSASAKSNFVDSLGYPGNPNVSTTPPFDPTITISLSTAPVGEKFRVYQPLVLEKVSISAQTPGFVYVELRDSLDNTLMDKTLPVSGGLNEYNLDFAILPNTPANRYYRLVVTNSTAGFLRYGVNPSATPVIVYPYTIPNLIKIMSTVNNLTNTFHCLFNWKIRRLGCESGKTALSINVYPTPSIQLTDTISCSNSMVLNMGTTAGATYSWTKVGPPNTSLGTNQSITVSPPSAQYIAQSQIITSGQTCSDQKTITAIFSTTPATPTGNANVTVCKGTNANLVASSTAGSKIMWWNWTGTGSTSIGSGSPLSYPISATDTLYAKAYNVSPMVQRVGITNATANATIASAFNSGLKFSVYKPLILDSLAVYPLKSGVFTILLQDNSGAIIKQRVDTVTFTGQYKKQVVPVGFIIPPGTGYKLVMGFNTIGNFKGQPQVSYPKNIPAFLSITGSITAAYNYYPVFYDWQVRALTCPSARFPVTVLVNPAPTKIMKQDTFACAPITLNVGNWGAGTTYTFTDLPPNGNAPLGGGLNNSISNSIGNGSHSVKITGALGTCSVLDTVNVDVFANAINVPTTTPITSCGGDLSLIANAGTNQVIWWNAATGGNVIGAGSPFIYTANGNAASQTTATVYAQSYALSSFTQTIGASSPNGTGAASGQGLVFTVSPGKAVFIDNVSVYYYNTNAVSIKIELQNSNGVVLNTSNSFNLAPNTLTAQQIPINFFVYEGTNYRLVVKAPNTILGRSSTGITFPYSSNGNISITGSINTVTSQVVTNAYNYLYNWKVRVLPCGSATRTPLSITILKSPVLDLGTDIASCATQHCFNAQNSGATFEWRKDKLTNPVLGTSSVYCATYANFPGAHKLYCIASATNTGTTTCRDTFAVGLDLMPPTASVTAPDVQQCGGAVQLTATSSNADLIAWWSTPPPSTLTVKGFGSPFTANINGTTTYNAIGYQVTDTMFTLGLQALGAGQTTGPIANTGMKFTVGYNNTTAPLVAGVYIDEISIYTTGSGGPVTISMYDAQGLLEASKTYNTIAQSGTSLLPTQIPLNFFARRGDHTLRVSSLATSAGLGVYETVASTFYNATTTPSLVLKENGGTPSHIFLSTGIASNGALLNNYYPFFNWKVRMLPVNNGCPSAADPATATILPTPNESQLPADTVLCTSGVGTNCVNLSMTSPGALYTWCFDPLPVGGTNPPCTYTGNTSICTPTIVTATAKIQTCLDVNTILVDIVTSPGAPIVKDTTVCPGFVQLLAQESVPPADFIAWYNAPTGGVQIGGGDTLSFVLEGGNQSVYAQSYNLNHFSSNTGVIQWSGNAANVSPTVNRGLVFEVYKPMVIDSVSLFCQTAPSTGTVRIELVRKELDPSTGAEVITAIYGKNWSDWSNIQTINGKKFVRIPLGFFVVPNAPGISYAMILKTNTNINNKFGVELGTSSFFPISVAGGLSINGALAGTTVSSNNYYYFYDWSVRFAKCASVRSPMNLTLHPYPTHEVVLGADFVHCGDTLVVLGANTGGPYPNGYTYSWGIPYSPNPISTVSSYNMNNAGTYIGIVKNLDGCAVSDTINVTINPFPVAAASYPTTFGPPCTVEFNNAGSSFGIYSWNFGDASSGANNTSTDAAPTHIYNVKGSYTVYFAVTNSCGTADTTINVDCYGVDIEDELFGVIHVFPNPASDILNVEFAHTNASAITLKLVNALGQILETKYVDIQGGIGTETLHLQSMSSGVYYLIMESEGKTSTQKIMIEQ